MELKGKSMKKIIKSRRSGFTMVELLIVLVIVGILAAIAAPIYLGSAKHAKASEAVAVMSMIRQAERESSLRGSGLKAEAYSTPAAPDFMTTLEADLSVYTGVNQYFSLESFKVETTGLTDGGTNDFLASNTVVGNPPAPVEFLITANGSLSEACTSSRIYRCATKGSDSDLANMCLQMDNSGRVFVNYNLPNCTGTTGTWEAY
jgi:prepilin-type N-terminal cleavage/methylation domain-containing protein